MAAAPVAALVAVADIAKTVVDAAIEADVLAPVAVIEPVMVIPVAPVAGRPQSTLVGSLHPRAGHPVVAIWTPRPIARRPERVVVGRGRLVVVGQRRRRLVSGIHRLLSVTRIIRTLVRVLVVVASRIGWRSALLGVVIHWRLGALLIVRLRGGLSARVCGYRCQVGRSRV